MRALRRPRKRRHRRWEVNAETKKAFGAETVRQRYRSQGTALPLGSPDEFSSHLAVERQRWGEVIRQAGIRLE